MPRTKTLVAPDGAETTVVEAAPPSGDLTIDLPPVERSAAPTTYIQNKINEWFIIESGNKDVAPIVLGPLAQFGLPNDEFWIKNERLRRFTDAPEEDPTQAMPLRLFARRSPYGTPKEIPMSLRCEEKYMNNVLQICYGPLDLPDDHGGAVDEIMLDPRIGNPPRTDVRFLVHKWRLVLESAQFLLKERRRTGHEVDSRRLEMLKTRLATIEEMRLDYGLSRKSM